MYSQLGDWDRLLGTLINRTIMFSSNNNNLIRRVPDDGAVSGRNYMVRSQHRSTTEMEIV